MDYKSLIKKHGSKIHQETIDRRSSELRWNLEKKLANKINLLDFYQNALELELISYPANVTEILRRKSMVRKTSTDIANINSLIDELFETE